MTSPLAHQFFQQTAAALPAKPYLTLGDRTLTFGDVDRLSDGLASELQAHCGVQRGDRVAVMLENSAELVIALWATLKAGAICVPLVATLKKEKLSFVVRDSGAKVVIAHVANSDRVTEAIRESETTCGVVWAGERGAIPGRYLAEACAVADGPGDTGVEAQDVCLIIYTSGSTGEPKGVMLTHANVCNNAAAITGYLRNTQADVILCVLPLCYSYGLYQILGGAYVGYTCLIEKSFAYPQDVLQRAAARKFTGLAGVPALFNTLLQLAPFDGIDLSSLRYMTNAAAPLAPSHIVQLATALPGVEFFSMYGLTECTRVCYLDPAKATRKPASVGQAMPNCSVFIVDEDGQPVPNGEAGELVVRGPNVMRGYWNRPEETARALREGPMPGEKVLFTGDIFRLDEEGDLHFVGRKDDVFKSGGVKVSPRELEIVLYELEAVAEAAVVGVPDRGDIAIKAFIVLREGHALTEAMVRKHCKERLEAILVPKSIELRASLPTTESGKISKAQLRREQAVQA